MYIYAQSHSPPSHTCIHTKTTEEKEETRSKTKKKLSAVHHRETAAVMNTWSPSTRHGCASSYPSTSPRFLLIRVPPLIAHHHVVGLHFLRLHKPGRRRTAVQHGYYSTARCWHVYNLSLHPLQLNPLRLRLRLLKKL